MDDWGHRALVAAVAAVSQPGKWPAALGARELHPRWEAVPAQAVAGWERHPVPRGLEDTASIYLWNLKTGKKTGFPCRWWGIRSIAYSARAGLAATIHDYRSVSLWNLETGKEVRTITGHMGFYGASVCFSPDGKQLLWTDGDEFYHERGGWLVLPHGTLVLSDVATGKELKRVKAGRPEYAAFSPDGKRIVTNRRDDNTVRVWDAATFQELKRYKGHTRRVTGVAFLPDGKRIASASEDGTARIWRAPR